MQPDESLDDEPSLTRLIGAILDLLKTYFPDSISNKLWYSSYQFYVCLNKQ